MNRFVARTLLVFLAASASACASARVVVDIHDGTGLLAPNRTDIGDLAGVLDEVDAALAMADGDAEKVAAARIEIAAQTCRVLAAFDEALTRRPDERCGTEGSRLTERRAAYEGLVGVARSQVVTAVAEARKALGAYRGLLTASAGTPDPKPETTDPNASEASLRLWNARTIAVAKLAVVAEQMRHLLGPLGSDWETLVQARLQDAPERQLNPENLRALYPDETSAKAAAKAAAAAAQTEYEAMADAAAAFDASGEAWVEAQAGPLRRLAKTGAGELGEDVGGAHLAVLEPGQNGAVTESSRRVGRVISRFSAEVLDREQDPADPNLRIISKKTRPGKSPWHREFAYAKFRATGKSGVVIVRDRVGRYRVQKAENDPKGVVEGGLKIARATADAAIKVAAAAGGFPMPGSTEDSAPPSPAVAADAGTKPEPSAAEVDAIREMRREARDALREQLRLITSALANKKAAALGKPLTPQEKARILGTLQAAKAMLSITQTKGGD